MKIKATDIFNRQHHFENSTAISKRCRKEKKTSYDVRKLDFLTYFSIVFELIFGVDFVEVFFGTKNKLVPKGISS